MTESNTSQSNIRAGGNVVGRDYHNTVNQGQRLPMSYLLERYRSEMALDSALKSTIDILQHFMMENPASKVVGVEEKLKRGGREDEIDDALVRKERFAKRLQSHLLSPVAQEIFACILGKLQIAFRTKIKPLILACRPRAEIDSVIMDDVITPCFDSLESNELKVYHPDLMDMLYFLTGNCHIDWH